MSNPKFAAIRGALFTALEKTDDPESRRYVREALQLLVALERDVDDSDGGDGIEDADDRRQDPPVQ